jgi:hypothetical protein
VFEHPFSDQTLLDVVGCKVSFFFFSIILMFIFLFHSSKT